MVAYLSGEALCGVFLGYLIAAYREGAVRRRRAPAIVCYGGRKWRDGRQQFHSFITVVIGGSVQLL